ncbi:MAG TPA: putative PEP-binding protein, partial [Clostridia bacterium]|nr:putative PEP-binding protein [Clostridia bacterium]
FASDPRATVLLLGMGLDEFSMSASSIPYVKNIILKHSKQEAQKILQAVMKLDSSSQIKEYLQEVQL